MVLPRLLVLLLSGNVASAFVAPPAGIVLRTTRFPVHSRLFDAARASILVASSTLSMISGSGAASLTTSGSGVAAIDSHLHVWGNGDAPFPYAEGGEPPASLREASGPDTLLSLMHENSVRGALIVQPINYKFNHDYVLDCIRKHPGRFKGMCLANPNLPAEEACKELARLHSKGFCSVRFNPYLWPEGEKMSDSRGLAMFRECGRLGMPVGVMCFKGFTLHSADITKLLTEAPDTKVIIDHFGFFRQGEENDEEAWTQLLDLAKFPQVYVKLSALFRVSATGFPFSDLQSRVSGLIEAFGAQRLMWGSDFPFVQEASGGYNGSKAALLKRLIKEGEEEHWVMHRTAETLFGPWEDTPSSSSS